MKNTNFLLFLFSLLLMNCSNEGEEQQPIETVVIGGGLMGSATAWQLSNQGNEVLLLEKQDSVYTQGSSYGVARIARSNNRGNDIWSYLHNKSVEESQVLINFLNSTTDSPSYSMEDLYTTLPVTYVGRTRIYEKLYASLIRQKVDYAMAVNPQEGNEKFGVTLPDSVLIQREFNQYSGTLNPRQLISYLHKAVRKKGNSVRYRTKVHNLQYNETSDLYEISILFEGSETTEIIRAKNVVAAAGPYNGTLLKNIAPYFDTLINPQRIFLAFFKINKDKYGAMTEAEKEKLKSFYPVINSSEGTRSGSFFSMIEYYDEDGIPVIKIGGHFQRTNINNLDEVWKKELADSEIEWSLNGTARYFKMLNLPLEKEDIIYKDGYSCVYSLTQTEIPFVTPIVDENHLPNERFVVLGGMSGVGAKGAMTYGLIAANILNKKTDNDSLYQVVKKELGVERLVADLKNEEFYIK